MCINMQWRWCVANPSTNNTLLQSNIDYACSHIDCSSLQEGGPCFEPDTLISHASVSMNLYFQSTPKDYLNCRFRDSGLIAVTDPSMYISSPLQVEGVRFHNYLFVFNFLVL